MNNRKNRTQSAKQGAPRKDDMIGLQVLKQQQGFEDTPGEETEDMRELERRLQGTQYGREMSQRPAAGTVRTVSNPRKELFQDFSSLTLSGGQEMELMQNGYTDVGDWRYHLDRSSGEVSMEPKPGASRTLLDDPQTKRYKRGIEYGQSRSVGQAVDYDAERKLRQRGR